MAWILLCKHGKFGEKICYNSRDIEFFLGDCFLLAHPVEFSINRGSQNGFKSGEQVPKKFEPHFLVTESQIIDYM